MAAGCTGLTASDQGVTPTQIHIAVDVSNLEGQAGNQVFGLPSPQDEVRYFQNAIDYVNRSGTVACRKLVANYYEVNALDPNQAHAECLQIIQDSPFAVLDMNLSRVAAVRECIPSAHIPEFPTDIILDSEAKQFYPYLFNYFGLWGGVMRDYVLGAHQLGWFNGAKKIGMLTEDCYPELKTEIMSDLAQIGIRSDQITTFDFGCPSGLIPPNQEEQAVLQFKLAGVTHVIDDGTTGENYFSKEANSQDYHPKYSMPDGGGVAIFDSPEFAPDANNFNGALAITTLQYGGEHSHLPENPGTAACDKVQAAGRMPGAETSPDAIGGVACDVVFMLAAALHNSPLKLARTSLAAGLAQVGPFDFSFPAGPARFDTLGVTTGGQYWRGVVYDGSCPCFKVPDPSFRPNF